MHARGDFRRDGGLGSCGLVGLSHAWRVFRVYLGLCVVAMLIYNIDNIHEGDGVNVKA